MEMIFTEENAHLMDMPAVIKLHSTYSESDRTLYLSKIMDRPFRIMDYKV